MTQPTAQLSLHPEKCDHCGRCVHACTSGALKVGVSYIYVDWRSCSGCYACVEACDREAIERRRSASATSGSAARGTTGSRTPAGRSGASAPAPVIAIGSRADAKAARKAAEEAEKRRLREERSGARRGKVVAVASARADAVRDDGMVCWTPADAAAVLAVLALTFVAKDAVLAAGPVRLMPAAGQAVARTVVLGAFYAVQLWLLGYLCARHGSRLVSGFGLGRLGRSWSAKAKTAGIVVLLALGVRLVSTLYGALVQALGWLPPTRAEGDLTTLFGAGGIGVALSVLLVVVVGPVAEELAFRGVIMSAAGDRWGKWPAVFVSAAVFSAYHFTLWLLVPTFVLGVALGWLAWERRSLWPAIVLHAVYNATAVAAAVFVAAR